MSNVWKHLWTTLGGLATGGTAFAVLHASCGVSTWQQYALAAAPIILGALAKDPHSQS